MDECTNPAHWVAVDIVRCCREWPIAVGYPIGRCGICGEHPREFVRHADPIHIHHPRNVQG